MKRARPHYAIVILALVVLAVFGSLGLARFGYAVVLPAMQEGLALTDAQAGSLQSWTAVGYLLVVAGAGMLATRNGPRVVISTALFMVAISMIGTGLATSFAAVCAARFATGIGSAAANIPAMGLVAAWFAPRRRGVAAGIGVGGSSLGLFVTGLLVPRLLAGNPASGWRLCWFVFGVLTLGVCLLCALFLRNRPADVFLAPLGSAAPAGAAPAAPARVASPRAVWRSGLFWHLAGLYFAFGFSYIIYATFFIKHLVQTAGMRLGAAGSLWSQIGVVSVVSGLIWGSLSDRWGRRPALACVFGVQGVAFLALGVAGEFGVYLAAALFALTAWSIPAVMAALAGDCFGGRLAPTALGLMTIVFGIGQALGPYVGGWAADRTGAFSVSFVLAGAVALVLGGGGALLLPKSPHVHG